MKKIMLVANTGWYLYNFRLPLARYLRSCDLEVVMCSPYDPYVERIKSEGFRWVEMKIDRRSMNPMKESSVVYQLMRIYRHERPDAVHHFTIKCVLYGTIAAKLSGIGAVVNAVTGLGHIFLGSRKRVRLVRPVVRWVYRRVLTARRVQTVVFQNQDDLQIFKDFKMIIPERTVLIRSSGVDLKRFSPRPGSPTSPPAPNVLFASRLIAEKGVYEFVEAARMLKDQGVSATFQIAGSPDYGNPSSITDDDLEFWRKEGAVDLLGHIDRVDEIISTATVVVLPSYREGTPRILLEAAAMGKPIVATDVPGCREAVEDGVNGILVPAKDPVALAQAVLELLNDPEKRQRMGDAGRQKMVREFDDQSVARSTAQIYKTIGVVSLSMSNR